jgi:REP element-mobilizing transposase RayT
MKAATDAFIGYATRAQSFNISVGRFVLMPDHLHLFVCGNHNFMLSEWVKGLKRGMSNAFSAGNDCATTRATARNGTTCAKTRFAPD